jgi:hypothetical protein
MFARATKRKPHLHQGITFTNPHRTSSAASSANPTAHVSREIRRPDCELDEAIEDAPLLRRPVPALKFCFSGNTPH